MRIEDEKRLRNQRRILWAKFVLAAMFFLPLLYLTISPMIWWLPIPRPSFLDPMQYPLPYALAQIGLMLPIILLGIHFILAGFQAFVRRSPDMNSVIAIGTTASLAYSLYSTYQIVAGNFAATEGLYFILGGAIITTALLGNLLETHAMGRVWKEIHAQKADSLKDCKETEMGFYAAIDRIDQDQEEVRRSKADNVRVVDVVAGYYVPVVCALGALAVGAWIISGQTLSFVLTVFPSMLLIASPSAIGIASSTAISSGLRKGRKYGILIKDSAALELVCEIDTVVLGKSGITEGKPEVTDIIPAADFSLEKLLQIAGSVEKGCMHPLAEAILQVAERDSIDLLPVDHFESMQGYGVAGEVSGVPVLIGSRKLMEERKIPLEELEETSTQLFGEGKTLVYIAMEGKMAGVMAAMDRIKENSAIAIQKLQSLGLEVVLLSNDHRKTAEVVARQVGISKVLAGVPPLDKHSEITRLQSEGRKVAVVGEGAYDAPALTHADIEIAFCSGARVTQENADIILMRNDLMDVPTAIQIGQRTAHNMHDNLFWAFGYHVVGIAVAAGLLHVFGGPLLNPVLAAAAMILGIASVLISTIRPKRFEPYLSESLSAKKSSDI